MNSQLDFLHTFFYSFALTCFITFQSGLVKHGLMHVPKLDLRFINLCYHKSLAYANEQVKLVSTVFSD